MYIESQIRQYWRFINFWRSKKEAAAPKSRRCICSPQSGDHTLPHRFRTAVLCITAKSAADGRDGVKMRKSHSEHFSTAVPQKADIARRGWHGRKVPTTVIGAGLLDHLVGSAEGP